MRGILLDTHVLVWYLTNRPDFADWISDLDEFAAAGGLLYVSAFSIVEMVMAGERLPGRTNRIDPTVVAGFLKISATDESPFVVLPLTASIAARVAQCRLPAHNDPGDRVIVATAREMGVPLMTHDEAIITAKLVPIIRV